MSPLEQKSCAKCGQPFGCGANTNTDKGCWCASLPRVVADPDWNLGCFCPKCLGEIVQAQTASSGPEFAGNSVEASQCERPLIEGEDYYREGQTIVFTALYHLRRRYCCDSSCRHCPYGETIESRR